MKLYSLKTLKDGKFRNVDIDETISAQIWKVVIVLLLIIETIVVRALMHLYSIDIITAIFALLACITVTIFCSVYILWYFIGCETYIEK